MFDVGQSSVDRYIRTLAVCSSLAELASSGSEAEFCDRIGTLMCLKKHWTLGHSDAKVVCESDEAAVESIDKMQLSVDMQNISMQSILSPDCVTKSQLVLVLCHKNITNDGTTCDGAASENVPQQTDCYNLFPSLLTVPSSHASKCLAIAVFSTRYKNCMLWFEYNKIVLTTG